jgi:hypothetical protein
MNDDRGERGRMEGGFLSLTILYFFISLLRDENHWREGLLSVWIIPTINFLLHGCLSYCGTSLPSQRKSALTIEMGKLSEWR